MPSTPGTASPMTPLVLRWPAAASSSPAPPSSSACQLQLHHRLHPTRLQGERSWLCTELATAPAKAAQKGCSAQLQTCLQALHLTSPKALPCLLQPGSHPAGLHIFSSIVFSHGYNSSTAGTHFCFCSTAAACYKSCSMAAPIACSSACTASAQPLAHKKHHPYNNNTPHING